MSEKATLGGVRLLGACAAIDLAFAALGWFWEGDAVAGALLDRLGRAGPIGVGASNWNALHVILWALWLSGAFAFLWARSRAATVPGGSRDRGVALAFAGAWIAIVILWGLALGDAVPRMQVAGHGMFASAGPLAHAAEWNWIPVALGAAVALAYFVVVLRRKPSDVESGDVSTPDSPTGAGADPIDPQAEESSAAKSDETDRDPPRATAVERPSRQARSAKRAAPRRPSMGQSPLQTIQFGGVIVALLAIGLFWHFVAFGPAQATWSLDRLYSGPAAEAWAAWTFLVVAHAAQLVAALALAIEAALARRPVAASLDTESD